MSRDNQAKRQIIACSAVYEDSRLTDALIRTFNKICDNREPDGCFSNSVALHVVLRSLGYNPTLCYGLCTSPKGQEFYHAWIELDGVVLDLSIYGNSHYSPFWNEDPLNPVIFESYDDTPVRYGNQVFDADWENCMISNAVKLGSIENYIAHAPYVKHPSGNGLWKLIFNILDEVYTQEKHSLLQQYVSNAKFT